MWLWFLPCMSLILSSYRMFDFAFGFFVCKSDNGEAKDSTQYVHIN